MGVAALRSVGVTGACERRACPERALSKGLSAYGRVMATETEWIPAELESVALRLARADQAAFEVAQLSMEWSRAGGNGPLTLHQVEDPPGTLGLVVVEVRPIPPLIPMLFSEAINHLRAAIDNTVFYLVEREQRQLDERLARRVAMPIFDDGKKLTDWLAENDRRGLSALGASSALARRIRSLQPFASDDVVPSTSERLAALMEIEVVNEHPLLLLQAYSNADKHRAIRAAAARVLVQRDDQPFSASDRSMRPIQPGDVLSMTPVGTGVVVDTNPAVHVERPAGTAWVSPGHELEYLRNYVASVAVPTLVTGLAIPRAVPPEMDLGDTGQTDRERIEEGSWQTAHERWGPIGMKAFAEAHGAPPAVPPTIRANSN